jgi:branched-chain amino acid transport system substrate-binding protein
MISATAILLSVAAATATEKPFRLGVLHSLTGSGESYGQVAVKVTQLAVDEINAGGGVNGRLLELVVEDSKCNGRDAIAGYTKLTQVDRVKVILGTSCSGETLAIADLSTRDKVIIIGGMTSSPAIRTAGDFIFRNSPSSVQAAIDVADYLREKGIRRLVTVNSTTDFAEAVQRAFNGRFVAKGGEVITTEKVPAEEIDFRSLATKIMRLNADAVFVSSQSTQSGGTFIKQLREQGYRNPIAVDAILVNSAMHEVAGDAATGAIAAALLLDPNNMQGRRTLEKFRQRYGYTSHEFYLATSYDVVHLVASCLKEVNSDTNTEAIRDCLYRVKHYDGAAGRYGFDKDGEAVTETSLLRIVEILPVTKRTSENLGLRIIR